MPVLDRPLTFLDSFKQMEPLLRATGSERLHDLRTAAYRRFSLVELPTSKDEEFKYTPLRELGASEFGPAYGATLDRGQLSDLRLGEVDAATLTFVNGQFAPELSDTPGLPEGVTLLPIEEALAFDEEAVMRYLGKIAHFEGRLGSSNDNRFTDLNTAFLAEGAVLLVDRGVQLEQLVHLQFLQFANHGQFAAHPRVLIALAEGASAKVIESYAGMSGRYFNNPVTEIYVSRGANLEHTRVQMETPEAIHVGAVFSHQEGDSVFTSNTASFGAQVSRLDLNVFLDGEHTETWLNGAYMGFGSQVVDNHTRIDHAKPNCNSFEVYKGILGGRSTGVFNGKIFVYEDAQKTDAKQTNQAMLLSPTSTINTKPQLEIFADDVKCTHGATVGQLREDALFYLRARGIPEGQAKGLLVYAFVAEVLEKISIDAVREALEQELYSRLASSSEVEELPEERE
ncbi:MAG TPA: Fe-S cluster assembly protein SufD [Fimbriimonadaceae bacterium]|nr:Fe-S cluster assembly protein SufD [Fimbriimonadaceae bacterium]